MTKDKGGQRAFMTVLGALFLAATYIGVGYASCAGVPFIAEKVAYATVDDAASPFDKEQLVEGALATRDYSFGSHDLAAYEDAMPLERAQELAQAEQDGRLVVLEPAAKEGIGKPPCFYNDMGQDLCLGFARGECDDEPIDRCKECWYCESTREEAEAALKKKKEENI